MSMNLGLSTANAVLHKFLNIFYNTWPKVTLFNKFPVLCAPAMGCYHILSRLQSETPLFYLRCTKLAGWVALLYDDYRSKRLFCYEAVVLRKTLILIRSSSATETKMFLPWSSGAS